MKYIIRIFYNLILFICYLFLNNINIKGLNINYNKKKVFNLLRIRLYITKYIKNLNNILYNIKLTKAVINT